MDMIRLAIHALESPECIDKDTDQDTLSALDSGPPFDGGAPEKREPRLLLLVALLYARPDLVNAAAVAHLEALLRDPESGPSTCRIAGEALQFAIASPAGSQAVGVAMRLLAEPNHRPEVYQTVIGALRWTSFWAMKLLDAEALRNAAGNSSLGDCRNALLEDVVEPCLFAAETVSKELQDQSPLHAQVAARLGEGRQRVLIVHNIDDGQGDEIVRVVPFAQALLDFNAELEIVLVTRRVYLYAHPRITAVPIGRKDRVAPLFREQFDGLVSFFEPEIKQCNYDPGLEADVDVLRRRCQPFLNIVSRKGYNHFLYERVDLDSQPLANSLGLDRRRVANNYEPTMRLIAELGLPLRRGQDLPRTQPVLAGAPWPEAEAFWQALSATNVDGRPVAILSPFGGAKRLKGYLSSDGVAAEIRALIGEGFFVVVMPNGASWGSTDAAREAVSLLAPDERALAVVGPAPDADPATIPPLAALPFADTVMRLTIYGVQYADLVVTVEGWMMHAAYCLGKPYRVLMMAYSHPVEWHPYGRTIHQGVFPAAGFPARDVAGGRLVLQQPRKWVFLFLLRELGKTGLEEVLPLLRRAIASDDHDIRLAAAEALAGLSDPNHADTDALLAPLLRDPSHKVRAAAAQAFLGRSVQPGGVSQEQLLAHAWIGRPERNWEPILRLGEAARPVLDLASSGDDPVIRREAAHALRILDFKPKVTASLAYSQRRKDTEGIVSRIWKHSRDKLKLPGSTRSQSPPKILILTPVKDAAAFIPGYYQRITRLTYPAKRISLGFLESDSADATYAELLDRLPRLQKRFRRAGLWKKDFGFQPPPGVHRWAERIQVERRSVLAKSRNHLLFHALDDEDWVLWLDVDVIEYPDDILQRMLATAKDIVHPHCVLDYGGPTFDRNAWRAHGKMHLEDMRDEGELVKLDAVGGTMLFVRADLHREGLIFPSCPYGKANPQARPAGELETEGLGIMALDMGYQSWGMPRLEIRHGKW